MTQAEFEAALRRDGYEIVNRAMAPNSINAEHAHDFDDRVMVVTGAMTVERDGTRHAYQPGESFEMPHGCRHAEIAGPDGATYIAGRRAPR
jgi:quercetin dioxygenase-like cupin family protein